MLRVCVYKRMPVYRISFLSNVKAFLELQTPDFPQNLTTTYIILQRGRRVITLRPPTPAWAG